MTFALLIATLACNAPGQIAASTPDNSLVETQIKLAVLSTSLAQQQATLTAASRISPTPSSTITGSPSPTPTISPSPVPSFTPSASATLTPTPPATSTSTAPPPPPPPDASVTHPPPAPSATPLPPTLPPPATATPVPPPTDTPLPTPTPTRDIQALIKAANILVYEDIRGYPDLTPLVNRVLKTMGLSGGRVEQVGDAQGTFLRLLNSSTKWDLIISASEARTHIRGEFWDAITYQVLENKAALVTEIWYLDQINLGRIEPFLVECGIDLQKNWSRSPGYDPNDYLIYWLQPNNPVFSTPNLVDPLTAVAGYWMGDVGDLIKITDSSKATMLAGLDLSNNSSSGVLASCMDGRVLFQTFSTHDYRSSDMLKLWENYIVYTLTNHFQAQP